MQKLLFTLFILSISFSVFSQEDYYSRNKGNGLLFKLSYAGHSPAADLADRFGSHFSVGSGLEIITSEKNWIGGIDMNYYFGNRVNDQVLSNIVNDQEAIIGNDRTYADIQLRMRAFFIGAHIGKLINLGAANPRSGIRLTVGSGLFQHKIRIQDDPVKEVPQLSKEYKKGYDRLTNGLAFTEFIGYQVLSRDKRINVYLGFEFTQAFTQSRRDYDFATMAKDETKRVDMDMGFRVGWILPFYFGKEADEIYY